MISVKTVIDYLESFAPSQLQEAYDNSGLITGNKAEKVKGVLITLDCTEEVVEEAINRNANLVIAHHPIIFKGLKNLTGKNYVERTIIKAIKNDIAIYAIHTNLDNINAGVNFKLASLIGLTNTSVLRPLRNLQKLTTFIPQTDTQRVVDKLHDAGAGNIGNYSECSFKVEGTGTFKPNSSANPAIGSKNVKEQVNEDRIEVIYPDYLQAALIEALKASHPYEEVAYYINSLENINQDAGAGLIGFLPDTLSADSFLSKLKKNLNLEIIKFTPYQNQIKKVAIAGGSGSFLLKDALQHGADAFVTGDVKYHDFFDAETKLMYCDIGHYESEVGTKDLLFELLTKKFTNFALYLSEVDTNPIKYYK